MRTSETTKNIAPAVTAASNASTGAKKDGKNPHYKSTYATLSSVINASNKPLVDNDLSIQQELGRITKNQTIIVVTRLTHGESSEWYETDTEAPLKNKDIHVLMSTFTYCRRNAISALLNMPVEDDDGNKSHDAKEQEPDFDTEPLIKNIYQAVTIEELDAIANTIRHTKMPSDSKATLRSLYLTAKRSMLKSEDNNENT